MRDWVQLLTAIIQLIVAAKMLMERKGKKKGTKRSRAGKRK